MKFHELVCTLTIKAQVSITEQLLAELVESWIFSSSQRRNVSSSRPRTGFNSCRVVALACDQSEWKEIIIINLLGYYIFYFSQPVEISCLNWKSIECWGTRSTSGGPSESKITSLEKRYAAVRNYILQPTTQRSLSPYHFNTFFLVIHIFIWRAVEISSSVSTWHKKRHLYYDRCF